MRLRYVRIIISGVAVVIALVHVLFPTVQIDTTTLVLLVIAGLPWLAPILKSVELPGGFKLEFQELQKAKEEAGRAGLLESAPVNQEPPYLAVAEEDPNLALAGLRIEIEKRLRAIAAACGLDSERQSIGQILRRLPVNAAISEAQYFVISDLLALLNRAVHGAEVDPRSARWAIDVGPRLLAALDKKVAGNRG